MSYSDTYNSASTHTCDTDDVDVDVNTVNTPITSNTTNTVNTAGNRDVITAHKKQHVNIRGNIKKISVIKDTNSDNYSSDTNIETYADDFMSIDDVMSIDDTGNSLNTHNIIDTINSTYSLWLTKNKGSESRMYLLDAERIMLNNWLKKTHIYRKATYRANIYYKQWDTFLGIIPIILNAIIILMDSYEFIYTEAKIITIITFAMLAVSTIFSSVHSFLKLSKQGESMRHVSDKLMQVYLQIQIYLAQSTEPLIPPVKFIEIVYKDIVALMEESGNIPIGIMVRYHARLQELDTANLETFT